MAEAELEAQVRGWLEKAQAADARDDEEYGADRSGEELPEWVADKTKRLEPCDPARKDEEEF